MRLSTRPTAAWSWLCGGLVACAGCSQEERLPVEAPAHFTPLPSHAPTAFASSQLQPAVKKSGATNQIPESVQPKGVAPNQ
jgi:hypothetical protein